MAEDKKKKYDYSIKGYVQAAKDLAAFPGQLKALGEAPGKALADAADPSRKKAAAARKR